MQTPIVSFEGFQSGDRQKILDTVSNVDRALSDWGFIASSDLGFSDALTAKVFEASEAFFYLTQKIRSDQLIYQLRKTSVIRHSLQNTLTPQVQLI